MLLSKNHFHYSLSFFFVYILQSESIFDGTTKRESDGDCEYNYANKAGCVDLMNSTIIFTEVGSYSFVGQTKRSKDVIKATLNLTKF